MRFVAIDIETANPDMSSICQIGIAEFADGNLVGEWSALIDPEDYFDEVNISIHGIEPQMAKGQPRLPDIAGALRGYLENGISVCHTHFDRIALARAFAKYKLSPISTSWLDSARVVRRTWKDLAWQGYGLKNVCNKIGYEFKHHDALEDAKAAGHVLLAAIHESKLDLEAWMHRVNQPIDPQRSSYGAAIHRDRNPEGDMFSEIVVFTGALKLPRNEMADFAASVGCQVASGVTKKTTILIVGDQDISKLAGHEKSAKHRKAELLAAEGYPIRIIRETDFNTLAQGAVGLGECSETK
ncbi:MAG: exonuclease domain-containing protein [Candidatus Nitrotoga sp.]